MQSDIKKQICFEIFPENNYNKVCFCRNWFSQLALLNNVVKKLQRSFFKQQLLEAVIERFSTKIGVLQKQFCNLAVPQL